MRTVSAAALIVTILFSCFTTFGQAQRRIRFAKGRTSSTVSGNIAAGGRVCYFAAARRGQTLTAIVRSRSGRARIFESGETGYSYEIEFTGDLSVCVDNLSRTTSYSLTVSIR